MTAMVDTGKGVVTIGTLVLLVALLSGCGSTVDVASSWSNSPVVIDGKADEWASSLKEIKDSPVMFGMRNDQDYLYICLESSDRQFRQQLMGLGMTIWFEPKGGDKIGIHYPFGMTAGMGMGSMGGAGGSGGERLGEEPPEGGPPDMREGRGGSMPEPVKELEILGPGKNDVERLPIVQTPGIAVQIGQSRGNMVYELKIPLKKTPEHPYAIASGVGSVVDVNFETGKFNPPSGRPGGGMSGGGGGPGEGGFPGAGGTGGGMGPPPGGMGPIDGGSGPTGGGMPGGGKGGGRGGREGGPHGGNRSEPKQFKLDVELTLASGPTSRPGN
jgi:hypothetical protein